MPRTLDIVTADELRNSPPVQWLIEGMVPEQGLAVLYGPPNVGKSFVALDWALSVAAGRPWGGLAVRQGPIVYVVAEGGGGMGSRVDTWTKATGCGVEDAHMVRGPIQLHEPVEQILLANGLHERGIVPKLIVFDTLAQCFVGGDENSSKDMGRWLAGARTFQSSLGATVLAVHHSTKAEGSERGSSALRGAADTMMRLNPGKSGWMSLVCDKQKDGERFDAIRLGLGRVDGGNSLVLELPGGTPEGTELATNANVVAALTTLKDGMRSSEWMAACGLPESTFQRCRRWLLAQGVVVKQDANYFQVKKEEAAIAATAAMTAI